MNFERVCSYVHSVSLDVGVISSSGDATVAVILGGGGEPVRGVLFPAKMETFSHDSSSDRLHFGVAPGGKKCSWMN